MRERWSLALTGRLAQCWHNAVLYDSVVVKKPKDEALTAGHWLSIVTERTRSRMQASKMRFVLQVAGPIVRDIVRSWIPRRSSQESRC